MALPIVGIDFGNINLAVSVVRRGGVDIITNEVSNRTTPAVVSFGRNERFIGESGLNQQIMNFRNTITQIKSLLGRSFNDPEVQKELARQTCQARELPNGEIGLEVTFRGEKATFTPEKVAAMLLAKLKQDVEKAIGTRVVDVAITCPSYWVESQRRALISAAEIAGLHVQRLINDTTATALNFGLFKLDLPEKDEEALKVLFVDMGHSSFEASVVKFTRNRLQVVGWACDQTLGGRDFDDVLVEHFRQEFIAKNKIDAAKNPRSFLRLTTAVEKLKKVLSANSEGMINVESLAEDVDVRSSIKRAEFEELASGLLDRVTAPIQAALDQANLTVDQIDRVEIIGSSLRIPSVQRRIEAFVGKELSKTQLGNESQVKGAALAAAMVSVGSRVREYHVQDFAPYPIDVSWYAPGTEADGNAPLGTLALAKRGQVIPYFSMLSLKHPGPFVLQASYNPATDAPIYARPSATSTVVGKWDINIPSGDTREIKVKIGLTSSGLVKVESVQLAEVVEVEETAAAPAADGTESPQPKKLKKQTRLTPVEFSIIEDEHIAPTKERTVIAFEEENALQSADRLVHETAERKNALEALILNSRSKLSNGGEYEHYAPESLRNEIVAKLSAEEDWLYDTDDDTTKAVFVEHFNGLNKLIEPIAERYLDHTDRAPTAVKAFEDAISRALSLVASTDAKYDHIPQSDRAPLQKQAQEDKAWLEQAKTRLASANLHQSLPVTLGEFTQKRTSLEQLIKTTMDKPKPAPPKPKPEAAKPAAESPKAEETVADQAMEDSPSNSDVPAEENKMEVD